MRVLVTGGAGFIGCNLVQHLLDQTDHDVLNLDKLTYAANQEQLKHFESFDQYRFVKLDLACDQKALKQNLLEFVPDRVIHLAAESHVDRSIDSPAVFIDSNIKGTFNLLETIRHSLEHSAYQSVDDFLLVHVSTDEVYGSLSKNEPPVGTSHQYSPQSPYSASKAASDHLVRAWRNTYQLPAAVAICCNNFGPFQHSEKLIPKTIQCAIEGRSIPVYGDGQNIRDWIYVNDCAIAISAIAEKGQTNQTYHVGVNCELTNIELVSQICTLLDHRYPTSENPKTSVDSYHQLISFVADRPGHDFRYALDSSSLQEELGWKPNWTFEQALELTVDWYLESCRPEIPRELT